MVRLAAAFAAEVLPVALGFEVGRALAASSSEYGAI
jgi:hypothetical protein